MTAEFRWTNKTFLGIFCAAEKTAKRIVCHAISRNHPEIFRRLVRSGENLSEMDRKTAFLSSDATAKKSTQENCHVVLESGKR